MVSSVSNIIFKKGLAVIFFILSNTLYAQRLYLNVSGGMINYSGDIQPHYFSVKQSNIAAGVGLSYKLTKHVYVNANYMYGKLSADDKFSSNSKNIKRNLSFFTNIHEGNVLAEYDLFDITETRHFTLYGFAGVGVYHFNPYAYDTSHQKVYLQPLGTEGQGLPEYPERKMYSLTQFNIPVGGGIKYALSPQVVVSFEVGVRNLFTDYLDDVSTRYPIRATLMSGRGPLAVKMSFRGDELKPPIEYTGNLKRGNPEKNDLYYTCLFKIAFAFTTTNGGTGYKFSKSVRKQFNCPQKTR